MPLSGPAWVQEFPASTRISDLVDPFRTNVQRFLAALYAAGARVNIADTLRPQQRLSLMYYSWHIARAALHPSQVPPIPEVDIQWVHTDNQGEPDLAASVAAAAQMVESYGIVYGPAIHTLHALGEAIDMDISWTGNLTIKNANGSKAFISSAPNNGKNPRLHAVGATYGVIKLLSDPPHWSLTGH